MTATTPEEATVLQRMREPSKTYRDLDGGTKKIILGGLFTVLWAWR